MMEANMVPGPRIRGRAYQLDDGLWTYFILLGEGPDETTIHCPAKYGWGTKEEAVEALKIHVSEALVALDPRVEITDNFTGKILSRSAESAKSPAGDRE